ncbi:MAG: S8 family serine peptidase, partial [Wenzhouxiangella sp.]
MDLHRQTRAPGTRFDASAVDMQSESQMMSSRHQSRLSSMSTTLRRDVVASHFFQVTHSGMAVRLTEAEARRISADPAIRSIQRERLYSLDTFAGPEFIGAGEVWDGTATPNGIPVRGLGMIAGVLDSGILPNHPSFLNDPNCGHGDNGIPNKLLSFVDCSSATGPGGRCNGSNPVDTNGHGTHVAGTMAGNAIGADANPPPQPPIGFGISGVAQCASIRNYKVCPGQSCPFADIQAGMNTLLLDGDVDAMNFSISGGTNPWLDADRRKLDLVDSGVFVNASAGNTSGAIPNPVGQVNHRGPWVTAVAMSTRPGGAPEGSVSITGPGTPLAGLTNIAVNPGSSSPPSVGVIDGPIRFDPDQPTGADGCVGFPTDFFAGAIALVERGTCAFADKINNAAAAGAIMVIIRNNQAGNISMNTSGQANVPAYSINSQATGTALRDFIAANSSATLRFTPSDTPLGDVLSPGSLRGPTPGALANLQKPDITAPGVGIYAAHVAPGGYANLTGTSMSGPHLSGAALLVRQMQPEWAPPEVASALRMTARKQGFKENGVTQWDWDDVGSGRVDLTRAGLAGFVMNEVFANFLAANPASGGDVRTLNLPAVRDVNCTPSCTFTRTVRNTLTEPTSWSVSSEMRSGNFDIQVSPSSFSFTGDTSETQTITVTISPQGINTLSFGTIDFVEAGGASPDLHWTIAAAGTGEGGPEPEGVTGLNFEGTVSGITGDPEGVWASDLRMNVTSPAGATFAVGGFGAGAAPTPWDFQGAGSATDGTYTSAHPNVFGAGTEQEGNWTFEFIHTYPPGATMTWDPVTIELIGPGRDVVLESINIPAFVLGGGQSTSFTILVGDETPPQVAVDPESLEFVVESDGADSATLTISNLGQQNLSFEFASGGGTTVLWDQPQAGNSGIVSSFSIAQAGGGYTAGQFELGAGADLSQIQVFGFDNSNTLAAQSQITWQIYRDVNDEPEGNPQTNADPVVWNFSTAPTGTGVSIGGTGIITLDLNAAGQSVNLDAGTYWLTVFPTYSGVITAADSARWNWFQADPVGTGSKLIAPNLFGNIGQWTLTGPGGLNTATADVAFTISGAPQCGAPWLSVLPSSGSVAGGEDASIDVSIDMSGLEPGEYVASLCLETNDPNQPLVTIPVAVEVAGESALLQVAHLAPFDSDLATTEVDILLNGEIALAGVPYGASTGPIPLPAGTYDIAIRLAGTSTEVLSVSDVELEEGVKYTAIANGNIDLQPLALSLLVDNLDPPAAGNFKLRLGHLAPFASGDAAAEVRLSNGDLIQAVDFGDITGFTELPAGTYDLQITGPGGTPVLIDPIPLTFEEGDIISAFAVGDGENQPLGIYALPPTAPGFFVPLVGQSAEIEVTPDNFGFTLEAGESTSDTLTIANLGNGQLIWSIDTAEGPAYGTVFGNRAPVNLPQGFDRASGRQVEAGAAFDAVILPAQQPAAITEDFSEGFDDITLLPGLGWALINNSAPLGGTGWFQGNPAVFPAHEGATN